MDRRSLLRTAPLLALAGCAGRGGSDDDGDDHPRVTERTFDDTGECSAPETATVEVSASAVRVEGCITGPNGCAVASLDSTTVDSDELTIVVTTERDAPPDVACTEALVYRSYSATISLDGSVGSVRVVHGAAGARETGVEESL